MYLKLKRRGPWRDRYAHRVQVGLAIAEWNPFGLYLPAGVQPEEVDITRLIPPDTDIHHIDHDSLHNCRTNLLMLPRSFHTAMDNPMCRPDAWMDDAPDWVVFDGWTDAGADGERVVE